MSWPISLSKTNVDEGSDSAASGRGDIALAIDGHNNIITARAAPNGVCDLDANTEIPSDRLPYTIYRGAVASNGTAVNLPSGWTSSRVSSGLYRITHNVSGGSSLLPMSTPTSSVRMPGGVTMDALHFDMRILDTSGVLADGSFNFHCLDPN